jgi:hypothetical protein
MYYSTYAIGKLDGIQLVLSKPEIPCIRQVNLISRRTGDSNGKEENYH